MLKYNFITNGTSKNEEIKYSEFYLSPDLTYISGVTSVDYQLVNNDFVNLNVPNYNGLYMTKINIFNVQRQGYVIFDKEYIIQEIVSIDGDKTRYIMFNDGKIYYESTDGSNIFFVNGEEYPSNGSGSVYVDTTYWIEDWKLKIDGEEYLVDLNLTIFSNIDGKIIYNTPYVKLNDGTILTPIDFEYDKWHYVTKFIIDKGNDVKISIDNITCAEYYRYIEYGNKSYEVNALNEVKIEDDIFTIYLADDTSKNLIDVDGTLCSIKYGWRSTFSGEFLYLFLSDNTSIQQGDEIYISPMSSNESKIPVILNVAKNIRYIIYNGQKYVVEEKIQRVAMIDDIEYEIFEDGKGRPYIVFNKIANLIQINGDKYTRNAFVEVDGKVVYKEVTDDIIYYDGVIIDKKVFTVQKNNFIYDGNVQEAEYIFVNDRIVYKYIVNEISSSNMLRCSLKIDRDNLTSGEIKTESHAISTMIYLNPNDFFFTVPNRIFGDAPTQPNGGMGNYTFDTNAIADALSPPLESVLKIYKIIDYITLPIKFDLDVANNLFQEMILEDEFYNTERKNCVNRIVDMERDIYVPVYKTANDMVQNFPIINELSFNLHFRTRNLETWKIEEDDGVQIEDENGTPVDKPSNWFIYDNNNYDNLSNEDKFNMSDLLYYLDFTNDDVFYQKSKLSKSFLRLSFYDSVDPKVQSLLHTSTIFLDEGELYLKYINNINNGTFIDIMDNKNVVEDSTSIGVSTEYSENNNIVFNEDKRLSCRFTVKNRYEEKTSSEGFYLYLFKEYSTNLHDRSIYMKVDFNHAGIGRTIPFMMPLDENGEIEKDIENFKAGYPLSDIYKQMFIEIKVVYDEKNKQYVYYTPFVGTSDTLTFNLFEIKIKDE